MRVFGSQTFLQFLDEPIDRRQHRWGIEQRYVISEASLREWGVLLANTLYQHHSSFDLADEITELGFPLVAQAMRRRDSGMPFDERTQMAHIGEVIGSEFVKASLGFETTHVFPKRLNPNVDQSMKGADVIGLRDINQPAKLLVGEAKNTKRFDKRSIEEGYEQLVDLHTRQSTRILRYMKEALLLKGDREGAANIDRHTAEDVPRCCLLLSITQSAPREPFNAIAERFRQVQVPELLATHIQIHNLETWLPKLFRF
jgi:hypothetical protein